MPALLAAALLAYAIGQPTAARCRSAADLRRGEDFFLVFFPRLFFESFFRVFFSEEKGDLRRPMATYGDLWRPMEANGHKWNTLAL